MNIEKIVRLKDQEEVLAVLRNHWLTRLPRLMLAFLLVAAPFFFMLPLFETGLPGYIGFVVTLVIGLYLAAKEWFLWNWNAFIVTGLRVIDVDQRGWFSRVVSEADYDRVEDISYSVRGIIGTVFGFGSLIIQTAGSTLNLELPHANDPKEAHHLITEAMLARRGASGGTGQQNGGQVRTARVSELLEAAAELDGPEARAFLTAIQQAVSSKPAPKETPDVSIFAPRKPGEDDDL